MSMADTSPRWLAVGRPALLTSPKRAPLQVTVRECLAVADAVVIEGEPRPYKVTLDEGPCAGLPLWAAERELSSPVVTSSRKAA